MSEAKPKFLQGIHAFAGQGYDQPVALPAQLAVSPDKHAQPVYLRAGNSSAEMIVLSLLLDGAVLRLFPIGAKAASHVPLAVVEDIAPDGVVTMTVSAPVGVTGFVALDFGLVEI